YSYLKVTIYIKVWYKKIINGEKIWNKEYPEHNARSNIAAIKTSAVRKGDDWVINGQKTWTSFGDVADKCFLLARTSTDPEKKHRGITAFIMDMNQSEVETIPIVQMDGRTDFNEVYM